MADPAPGAARFARRPRRPSRAARLHRAGRCDDRRRQFAGAKPRRRPVARRARHPRRRCELLADSPPDDGAGARLSFRARRAFDRRFDARDGARRRRRGGADRSQGGRALLAKRRNGRVFARAQPARGARAEGRRLWRGGRGCAARAARSQSRRPLRARRRADRDSRRARRRARSARRRHRPRAARPDFATGARSHRPRPAGIAGALDDAGSAGRARRAADRGRRAGLHRRGEQGFPGRRLGGARSGQCLAELLRRISIASPSSSR